MKKLNLSAAYKYYLMLFVFSCIQLLTWGQDSTSTSTSTTVTKETTTTTQWYTEPWVWVVGGAVLLIVIIALMRGGNSNSTKEVSRTTVIKED